MLFAVFILAAILTALLGGVLFSVNTLNETKYRANAIAAASACLDEFKKARAAGWVIFCNGTTENNGNLPYREVTCPNAGGAIANGGPTATFNIIGSNGTNAGGVYSARITAEGDCGCLDNNGHVNEQVKIRVQVNWERFRGGNEANVATQFTASKNRTATVEQIFYRYQDEQYISPNACNP
jgi:type II secretory pathway pseudopilin PulG